MNFVLPFLYLMSYYTENGGPRKNPKDHTRIGWFFIILNDSQYNFSIVKKLDPKFQSSIF